MLVDINLLPRKEPRRFGFFTLLAILVLLLFATILFYFWQIHTTNNQLESVDKEIALTNKIVAEQNNQYNIRRSSSSVRSLENSISWVESNRIKTIPVMDELTSMLPERGFIFDYQSEAETGTVQLTVQFDTASDAAYYLDRLNHSKMIDGASIRSLTEGISTTSNQDNNPAGKAPGLNNASKSNPANLNKNELPRFTGLFTMTLDSKEIKKAEKQKSRNEGQVKP